MFVLKSKYKDLEKKLKDRELTVSALSIRVNRLIAEKNSLVRGMNDLVEKINLKGGKEFLDRGVIPDGTNTGLSQEDIKRLIQLCHPDKHGGRTMASEMTAKLLSLRK